MGSVCTCEKGNDNLQQETINQDLLRLEEQKKEESRNLISKWIVYSLHRKTRKLIQFFIAEKVKNFIYPPDGREKFRNKKYYFEAMTNNIDLFEKVFPKDKSEYKEMLTKFMDFSYSFEILKKLMMKTIVADDYQFYQKFQSTNQTKNQNKNLDAPKKNPITGSPIRSSFRRKNSAKKNKRTIKGGNKPIITLLSTKTTNSSAGTNLSKNNSLNNNNYKVNRVEFRDTKINEEFDIIFNYATSNSCKFDKQSFLFLIFEQPSKISPLKIPKYIYRLVHTFYCIYLYKKSNWIISTNNEIKKFLKKPLKKCLDFRLKENERHSAKAAKFAAENLSNKGLPQKKATISLSTQENNMYNGEYDILSSLYHGKGVLIKDHSNYYYEGTFINGKKSGFGILIKILSDTNVIYYRGEFSHNKFHGFGMKFTKNDIFAKFQVGIFKKGKIIKGEEQIYYLTSVKPTYTKYKGSFDQNELYSGDNYSFIKTIFRTNKNDSLTIESLYEYKGRFVQGKPNGFGILKENLIVENYSYTYSGNFVDGIKEGFGLIEFSDNFFVKSYEGFFHEDKKFYLYGKVNFKSGDIYEGFFDGENYKSDLGLYCHYDSNLGKICDNFFGFFFKDKKNGLGRFIAPRERKSLIGSYTHGEKVGVFELNTYSVNEISKNSLFNFGMERTVHERKEIENNLNLEIQRNYDYSNIKRLKMFFLMEHNDIIDKADKKEALFM